MGQVGAVVTVCVSDMLDCDALTRSQLFGGSEQKYGTQVRNASALCQYGMPACNASTEHKHGIQVRHASTEFKYGLCVLRRGCRVVTSLFRSDALRETCEPVYIVT